MKKILFVLAALAIPHTAFAHEKWFVTNHHTIERPELFLGLNATNIVMGILALAAIGAAFWLDKKLENSKAIAKAHKDLDRVQAWGIPVVRLTTGVLMFTASYIGFFFAPDLKTVFAPPVWGTILLYAQAFIGLGLILGVVPRLMAAAGFLLYAALFVIFPPLDMLPYFVYAGIFLYLLILGDSSMPKVKGKGLVFAIFKDWLKKLEPYAFDFLRIGLAVSLILPALLYKIIQPEYALAFVASHPVNFMQGLGFTQFTDAMFVLCAGLTEFILGTLLLFGVLPRFIVAVLIFAFTVTLTMFGMFELLGHLPLYGAAYAILVGARS
ncbi:hypothetical protein COV82_06105 [Candidatus Peregrinibacteria bacterium CG11_big_fil_rev_8_21_14_0_20_46_8]|nr:MAG: hypothetical protein COV82_06105 [Candidatus Peregrinibacteria bacterium CG11_big_fil_rev_8_21_14_0_20_46_8]